ncbi:hypothetical protein ACOME3_001582 [Neoechinorhynchus agilis]
MDEIIGDVDCHELRLLRLRLLKKIRFLENSENQGICAYSHAIKQLEMKNWIVKRREDWNNLFRKFREIPLLRKIESQKAEVTCVDDIIDNVNEAMQEMSIYVRTAKEIYKNNCQVFKHFKYRPPAGTEFIVEHECLIPVPSYNPSWQSLLHIKIVPKPRDDTIEKYLVSSFYGREIYSC